MKRSCRPLALHGAIMTVGLPFLRVSFLLCLGNWRRGSVTLQASSNIPYRGRATKALARASSTLSVLSEEICCRYAGPTFHGSQVQLPRLPGLSTWHTDAALRPQKRCSCKDAAARVQVAREISAI